MKSVLYTTSQIIIKPLVIYSSALKLKTISSNVQNRNLSISFTYSEGKTVEQLKVYSEKLKATGEAIGLLMEKTAILVDNAAKQFVAQDSSIASQILKEKK